WRVTLAVYVLLYGGLVVRLGNPFAAALALRDPLHDLQAVFGFLETHRYRDPGPLRDLCAPFLQRERRPSTYLARVGRVLAAASVRGNPPLWMALSVLMPWDLYVMRWLDRSRAALADLLPQWLDVWFEVEALSALATLAYLNPDYTFPEILGGNKNDPLLEARALGHPLIPDTERVCNDFTLRDSGDLAMITGSNMSGKSTFLRTIGVNVCLAYAGGPVNAQFFRAVPLRLYTCIRVTDSVTDGISYFYAEVKSLKRLLDALDGETPYSALYLIDEIFRGTNNRERLTGSRAYIRALVGRRGAGLLSTHDLELVHLADELPGITNYHFAETVAEGRMMFDYTLRPGPCPTTNALKIMQMEGLPVE
ncbi:MAG: DNA mismatch repair protein MutS, partial [Anaerolineae bacterium]|nr:DNA mismatch repair protein MutS [Anaerolineae bacterium]